MDLLTLLAVFHIFVAVILVCFVLLQDPKGGAAGMFGGGGGGGQGSFFGATGAGNFLTKLTKWTAIVFALTSVATTYMTSKKGGSVMDSVTVPEAPIEGDLSPSDNTPAKSSTPPEEGSSEESPAAE